jgi:hypothetical protein
MPDLIDFGGVGGMLGLTTQTRGLLSIEGCPSSGEATERDGVVRGKGAARACAINIAAESIKGPALTLENADETPWPSPRLTPSAVRAERNRRGYSP